MEGPHLGVEPRTRFGHQHLSLAGTPDEAFALLKPFPADRMMVHQSGEGLNSDHGGLGVT